MENLKFSDMFFLYSKKLESFFLWNFLRNREIKKKLSLIILLLKVVGNKPNCELSV